MNANASRSGLIFVTDITVYIRGGKIVMWRNFSFPCMTKLFACGEILGNVGKFCYNLCAFMWRKIEPKSTFVEKKGQI